MVTNNFKKIVLLKNIPSNLVEEAFVVLKPNKVLAKKEKTFETFEYKNKFSKNEKENDYIIKEAENIIFEYIKGMENNKQEKNENENIKKKYKKLKVITIIISILYLIELLY